MSINNYSDDPRHDLEIYEQEQEKMDRREERMQYLIEEAEKIYRNEELGSLLCWCAETGRDSLFKDMADALKKKDYEQAGIMLGVLVNTYAPSFAYEYAEKRLAYEDYTTSSKTRRQLAA